MRKGKLIVLFTFILCASLLLISPVTGQTKKGGSKTGGSKAGTAKKSGAAGGGSAGLGKKIFDEHCATCHEGGNNSIEADKTLKADALKKNGFNSAADVQKRVQEGKGIMPEFRKQLKPAQINAVAAYVWGQSQKGWK